MKYQYVPQGVCSRLMEFEIEDGKIVDLKVFGGCHGNLQGISALVRGRSVDEVIKLLEGIRFGHKATSCPDQIACALRAIPD